MDKIENSLLIINGVEYGYITSMSIGCEQIEKQCSTTGKIMYINQEYVTKITTTKGEE